MGFPDAFAGEMGANFVVVASDSPLARPGMATALAADFDRTGMVLLEGAKLDAFVGDAIVLTDDFGPVDQLFTR